MVKEPAAYHRHDISDKIWVLLAPYISRERLLSNLKPELVELLHSVQDQLGVTPQQSALNT